MVDGVPEMICRCEVKSGKIIFCPLHGAAESLFEAVEYARRFLGDCQLAVPGQEATKAQIILPYLDRVLAKAREKPQ